MHIFKDFTFKWWQAGIFKIALLSLGIVIGSTWPEFFKGMDPFSLPVLPYIRRLCHLRVVEAVKIKHCLRVRSLTVLVHQANEYLQHETGRYLPGVNSPRGLLELNFLA